MFSRLIDTQEFAVDLDAQQFHQAGLSAERAGDFATAHQNFESAQAILAGLPPSTDQSVQMARVRRDDGFTDLREGIHRHEPALAQKSDKVISEAAGTFFGLILRATNTSPGPEPPLSLTRSQLRELYSELGTTVSLIGRVAQAKEVIFGEDDTEPAFESAHSFLRQGSNGYYRVSNAMVGARRERLHRNYFGMAKWLGRAATGIAWTAAFDQRNFFSAFLTAGSRSLHLRRRSATIRSVAAKP